MACAWCLTSLLGTEAHAQDFGLLVGINRAEINTSGAEGLNVRLTQKIEPVAGVLLNVGLVGGLSIEPELLFSTKGSWFDRDRETREYSVRLRYLELPVLLRYTPHTGRTVQFHVMTGPSFARLLSARATSPGAPDPDLEEAFASSDTGWVVGFGLGVARLRADLRYTVGFTDVARQGDLGIGVPAESDVRFRNRALTLLAAVTF